MKADNLINSISKIFTLGLFFCSTSIAQENLILNKYFSAIKNIKTIKYSVQRIDTFTDGEVWNHKGKCVLRRDSTNSVLGFEFWGYRSDLEGKEDLYDGSQVFRIDHKDKSYDLEKNPGWGIMGLPGGQMVVREFIRIDTGYSNISTYQEDEYPVIRFDFPDNSASNIFNRHKVVYLNAKTFLPYKVVDRLIVYGKKSVSTYIVGDTEINNTKFSTVIDEINFLNLYKNKTGEGRGRKQLVDSKAPDFALTSFDGKIIRLNDFLGKVVVLDFWETWCSPCRESMPKLQAIYELYNSMGLVVIGIHGDFKNIDVGKQILKKNNITFMNLSADQKIIKDYDILAVPRYIVIDQQGKIIYSHEGYSDSLKDLIAKKFSY